LVDPTGRTAAILFSGAQSAGTHRVAIDGAALSQGIYYARLAAEGQNLSQKLILIK